jgi:hypothetical protein
MKATNTPIIVPSGRLLELWLSFLPSNAEEMLRPNMSASRVPKAIIRLPYPLKSQLLPYIRLMAWKK